MYVYMYVQYNLTGESDFFSVYFLEDNSNYYIYLI